MPERIEDLHDRLDKVCIERLDWRQLLDRYDTPETCFFCDPPYVTGTQATYTTRWDEAEHEALRDRLMDLQGRWLLTYDDSPLVRELYAGCRIEEVSQRKGISAKAKGPMRQVIVRMQCD